MKQLKLLVTYAKNKKANIKNIDKTVAKQGNTWINCDFKDQISLYSEAFRQLPDAVYQAADILQLIAVKSDILTVTPSIDKLDLILENGMQLTLAIMSINDYPILKSTNTPEHIINFRHDFSLTNIFMADKDARSFLCGSLFEIKEQQLNIVATDAHRLKKCTYAYDGIVQDYSAIINNQVCKLLDKFTSGNWRLTTPPKNDVIEFSNSNVNIITAPIDRKYPDYGRVIPLGNDKKITVNVKTMIDTIKLIGKPQGILKGIWLTIDGDKFSLNNGVMMRCEYIDAHNFDTILTTSVNQSYLNDILISANAPTLTFNLFDSQRSILITNDATSDIAVLMPLRS